MTTDLKPGQRVKYYHASYRMWVHGTFLCQLVRRPYHGRVRKDDGMLVTVLLNRLWPDEGEA